MAGKTKTYFLSDLHLGAKYYDNPIEKERKIVGFLDHIKHDAKAIYLLGDILDYWFEYKYVVPRGYTRFFGKLAELSDAGIKITWFIGNHDIWIFDYIQTELGIEVIDGSIERLIDGKIFFLTHGDGVGKLPTLFKIIRAVFRNKTCQKLYAMIHPRWTIPFALSWSNTSRQAAFEPEPYRGKNDESLILFAKQHHENNKNINYFIFGHRHILVSEQIAENCKAIILGEWISTCSYAVFDGIELTTHKWQ